MNGTAAWRQLLFTVDRARKLSGEESQIYSLVSILRTDKICKCSLQNHIFGA